MITKSRHYIKLNIFYLRPYGHLLSLIYTFSDEVLNNKKKWIKSFNVYNLFQGMVLADKTWMKI